MSLIFHLLILEKVEAVATCVRELWPFVHMDSMPVDSTSLGPIPRFVGKVLPQAPSANSIS